MRAVIIYKYPLEAPGTTIIVAPFFFGPLHVGEQDGDLMLWAEVDTDSPPDEHRIMVVGTGLATTDRDNWSYVGTAQMSNGLVWHVYHRD